MKNVSEATYDFKKDFDELVEQIGEFRMRHLNGVIKHNDVIYTWADLGGDKRLATWLVGEAVIAGNPMNGDMTERIMFSLKEECVDILDYLKANYKLPSSCDDRTWIYLADKCAKTISFGASWTQVLRFIDKELEYFEQHPRDKDGKRGRRE